MLSLASELKDLRCKWQTLSIYERFEQTVLAELTTVIAIIVVIASWQLLRTFTARTASPQKESQSQKGLGLSSYAWVLLLSKFLVCLRTYSM